jgi:uncharacterized protein with ParB-like and HNH nuclease domain
VSRIEAHAKTIYELLNGAKYALDYYQREYKWETRQVTELLDDLEAKFLADYDSKHEQHEVGDYGSYFLGSIVLSNREGHSYVIDGQQRLTSLTLLIIHLRHLQPDRADLPSLVFSQKFGKKSFNVDVPDRENAMKALYDLDEFDAAGAPESVRNVVARYADLKELLPESLSGQALPYFTDWLLHKVLLVQIVAHTDEDAYTIFETMNDRGLSLSPTEMLKGYLLANLRDDDERAQANDLWRVRTLELSELGKDEELDFFKAWLRSQYAETIRERKKSAVNQDFEDIGVAFHKWVRDKRDRIGLNRSEAYGDFIERLFERFSRHYMRARRAGGELTEGLEYVRFNALNNFTLQYPLMLAPLKGDDDPQTVDRKMQLVAGYLDIFIARRVVNFRTLGYSAIVYTMFNLMKEIRNRPPDELATLLQQKIEAMDEHFDAVSDFYMHQQNQGSVYQLLARMTYHVELESKVPTNFGKYVDRKSKGRYDIEHIWPDKYERYENEFPNAHDFNRYRNHFGGLVLLPERENRALGADPFERKLAVYLRDNLLAASLNKQAYQRNPGFKAYIDRSGLPFEPPDGDFRKDDLDARQQLYRRLCEEIWSTDRFEADLAE